MTLRDRLSHDMKLAMKSRDVRRVSTLRMVLAGIQDKEIRSEKPETPVSEDEVIALLGKMIRQREESASTYESAGRPELAAAEREEVAIIREFLPRRLSETEIGEAVRQAIAETGAASPKEMGKVMAALKQRYTGSMDLGKAGALVKELLATNKP